MFAVEHWDVEPDIVCLAKGIASGMPLGAIIAREAVMDWPPGSHASTFGGNPVSCRAALATLDLLEAEYMANAPSAAGQLKAACWRCRTKCGRIGEVRGLGLMVAMDMVKEDDPQKLDPDRATRSFRPRSTADLLLLGCGESAMRFCPPLCITAEQVDTALEILHDVVVKTSLSRESRGTAGPRSPVGRG